jgi:hypothetical protein
MSVLSLSDRDRYDVARHWVHIVLGAPSSPPSKDATVSARILRYRIAIERRA